MKKILKPLFFFILIFFLFLLKPTNMALAVEGFTSSLGKFQQELQDAVDTGEPSLSSWVGGSESVDPEKGKTGMVPAIINSFNTLFFPVIVTDPSQLGQYQIKSYGAILTAGNIIPAFYTNPPASSIEYFADLGRNAGLVSPVYAQGVGFISLTPYLKIWKAFRNLAYFLIILISVVLGLMIMFRVRLSPQAVISIQDAIPKIVTGLILITFSYAIAGFLIDLMYLLISIFIQSLAIFNVFSPAEATKMSQDYLSLDLMGTITTLSGNGINVIKEIVLGTTIGRAIIGSLLAGILIPLLALIPGIGGVATGGLVTLIKGVGGVAAGAGTAGASIFILGLGIVIFGLIIQATLMFVKTYLSLLFNIILGPIIILFSILPSKQGGGAGSWIKSILSQILVFVFGVVILILGQLLMGISGQSNWGPPFIGNSAGMIKIAIGLGILTILPHLDEMVKALLESKGLQLAISTREFDTLTKQTEGIITDPRRREGLTKGFGDIKTGATGVWGRIIGKP